MSLVTPRKGYKSVPWLFGKEIEIPEGWEKTTVGKHTFILIGNAFPSKEYSKNPKDMRLLRGDNITEGTARWKEKTRYWSNYSEFKKYQLFENDFVISMDGSKVGKNYTYIKKLDLPCLLVQRVACLRSKSTLIQKYFGYIFGDKNFINYVNSVRTNSGIPHISTKDIQKFSLLLPPLPEQKQIATILSNVDNLIESTGKVITHSKKVKTGLMQKLLTRGIGHVTFKKVPWLFGKEIEIPQEWEIVKLKEISKLQGGYAFKSEDYQEQGIQLLKIANVSHGEFNWNEKSFVPKNYWNEYDDFQIKKGDIILAMTRPIISGGLKIAIFNETKNILLNQRVGKFILQNVNSYFFFCMINQKSVIEQIITKIGESGQPNISSDEVGEIKICYNNNIQEQQKIATILSNIDSKITSQEQYKEKLQKLKKSLMQKLLTGEVRV